MKIEIMDNTVRINMPLFGDFVDLDKSEYEKDPDAVKKKVNDVLLFRIYLWINRNFPRCVPQEKWQDLLQEELDQQIEIDKQLREIMGIKE